MDSRQALNMRLFSLPPAARQQIWSRYTGIKIAHSMFRCQEFAAHSLGTKLRFPALPRRMYATVHINENDEALQPPLINVSEVDSLPWDGIWDAARKSIDERSQATQEEKDAVLAKLRLYLSDKPRPGTRRRAMKGFKEAISAGEPLVAIRQVLKTKLVGRRSLIDVSKEIRSICNKRGLKLQTHKQFSTNGDFVECALSLDIPGLASESTNGTGIDEQEATIEAWSAMRTRLGAIGVLSKLFTPSADPHSGAYSTVKPEGRDEEIGSAKVQEDVLQQDEDSSVEVLKSPAVIADSRPGAAKTVKLKDTNEDIELAEVQEEILRQEKDSRVDVFNYAARFGLVPQLEIGLLEGLAGEEAVEIVQVSIKLPEQNIDIVVHSEDALMADVAAMLAFKRAAEGLQVQPVQVASIDNDFGILGTGTARDFVDYFRKLEEYWSLDFDRDSIAYKGANGHVCQLILDGMPIGRQVMLWRKKDAEKVACLTGAIELARKRPDILSQFAAELSKGSLNKLEKPRSVSVVQTTLNPKVLDIMQQALTGAHEAGLSDDQEMLEALEETSEEGPRKQLDKRIPTAVASQRLLERLRRFEEDPGTADLRKAKAALPMRQYSSQVLDIVSGDVYSIIVGATGSGKTTQVVQIILEDAIRRGEGGNCDIICTQPRRLAATSVAQRVAAERGERLSESVGYQVRGDSRLPQLGGSVTYCTTGVLLERLKWNPDEVMDNVSHLVIDEVHERDIFIDFLLVVLKKAITARQLTGKKVPRVVLMSATMDTKMFSAYLPNEVNGKSIPCPSLDVPGRTFPVKEKYLGEILGEITKTSAEEFRTLASRDKDDTKSYLDAEKAFEHANSETNLAVPVIDWKQQDIHPQAAQKEEALVPIALVVAAIAHICKTTTDGAILVFLPGLQEITSIMELMEQSPVLGVEFANDEAFQIHALHSTVPAEEQREIFKPTPTGCRRIILSTNIAETSVTVPDVKHVVDVGKLREKRYDHIQRISTLETVWESDSNARQRAGRAGRVSNGHYYALYSYARREAMSPSGIPALLRTDLQETCLSIKAQGFQESVSDLLSAAIEPPSTEAVQVAVENLKAIGAFTDDEKVTALGSVLAKLPVHPSLGKMILLGLIFRCLDPMIIFASTNNERPLFVDPPTQRMVARATREDLNVANSDHIALLKGFQELRQYTNDHGERSTPNRARERFMHYGAFRAISRTAMQIEQILVDAGLLDENEIKETSSLVFGGEARNSNSNNINLIKSLLLAGLNPNISYRGTQMKNRIYRTALEDRTMMHPSSVNAIKFKPTAPAHDQIYTFTTLAKSVAGDALFMRDSSLITPLAALLFGGRLEAREENSIAVMDKWLSFKIEDDKTHQNLRLIMEFREAKDRMLNGAFGSLSTLDGGAWADDSAREAFARGLVRLLNADDGLPLREGTPSTKTSDQQTTAKQGEISQEDAWGSIVELYNSNAVAHLEDL